MQAELYQSTSKGKGMNRMQEKVEKCPTHKVILSVFTRLKLTC